MVKSTRKITSVVMVGKMSTSNNPKLKKKPTKSKAKQASPKLVRQKNALATKKILGNKKKNVSKTTSIRNGAVKRPTKAKKVQSQKQRKGNDENLRTQRRGVVAKLQQDKRKANINARRMGKNPQEAMKAVKQTSIKGKSSKQLKAGRVQQKGKANKGTAKSLKAKDTKKTGTKTTPIANKKAQGKKKPTNKTSTKTPQKLTKKNAKKDVKQSPTTSSTKKQKKQKTEAQKTKEKQPTSDDLDYEMAEYWYKAGKGEDPKVIALNQEMDGYWSKKPENTEENSTEKPAELTADTSAPVEVVPTSTVVSPISVSEPTISVVTVDANQ